jgi:hypothetical protein
LNYLRVKNWDKFQHQSNKPLPWIKFFTALLAPTKDPDLLGLADHTRLLLYHIWLMARVFNGRVPENWLTREKLNVKTRIDLSQIIDLGYIWFETESGEKTSPSLSLSRARVARYENLNTKTLQGKEPESKESKKKRSEDLVEEFALSEKHREWAAENAPSVPIDVEFEAWRDRLRNNGYTSGKAPGIPILNPQASFYNAMRNAENWGTYRNGGGVAKARARAADEKISADPVPEDAAEMSRRDVVYDYAHRTVYDLLRKIGDPDESEKAREDFNRLCAKITPDNGEDRWEKWKSVCAEEGVNPREAVS